MRDHKESIKLERLKMRELEEKHPELSPKEIASRMYSGKKFIDIYGDTYLVTEYIDSKNVTVRYPDGLVIKTNTRNIRRGNIRHHKDRKPIYEDTRFDGINNYYDLGGN